MAGGLGEASIVIIIIIIITIVIIVIIIFIITIIIIMIIIIIMSGARRCPSRPRRRSLGGQKSAVQTISSNFSPGGNRSSKKSYDISYDLSHKNPTRHPWSSHGLSGAEFSRSQGGAPHAASGGRQEVKGPWQRVNLKEVFFVIPEPCFTPLPLVTNMVSRRCVHLDLHRGHTPAPAAQKLQA